MCHDDETELNVPIFFALLDSRSSWAYWHLLHQLLVITEIKFNPLIITTDFEASLIKAVFEKFPERKLKNMVVFSTLKML